MCEIYIFYIHVPLKTRANKLAVHNLHTHILACTGTFISWTNKQTNKPHTYTSYYTTGIYSWDWCFIPEKTQCVHIHWAISFIYRILLVLQCVPVSFTCFTVLCGLTFNFLNLIFAHSIASIKCIHVAFEHLMQ